MVIVVFSWMNFLYAENNGLSYFEDQDGDELADEEELVIGTDPANPDSDGDGYSDGVEVASGFDPLIAAPNDRLAEDDEVVAASSEKTVNLTDTILANLEEQNQDELDVVQTSAENDQTIAEVLEQQGGDGISLTESDIENVVSASMDEAGLVDEEMELVSEEALTILPAPEGDEEEVLEEEKKQVEEYFVQVAYIITENTGYLTGDQGELMNELLGVVTEVSLDIEEGDDSTTKEIKEEGEGIYEKLEALEVPYVLKDVHVMGISLLKFLLGQNENLVFDGDDPAGLALLVGKLNGTVMGFDELGTDVEGILDKYDIETFDVDSYIAENNVGVE